MKNIVNTYKDKYYYKAITVKQPFANNLIKGSKIIIVSEKLNYRGPLIVCSDKIMNSRYKRKSEMRFGKAVCYVDAIDCMKISDLTDVAWRELSGLKLSDKFYFKHCYAVLVAFNSMVLPIVTEPRKGLFTMLLSGNQHFYDVSIPQKKKKKRDFGCLFISIALISGFLLVLWAVLG